MIIVRRKNGGFTLIELLVIISIIGFLASALLVAFSTVRIKARDARRKADLVQIKKALLLYADNHGGVLPTSGFGYNNDGQGWATNNNGGGVCYGAYGDLEDFLDGTDPDIPAPIINYIKMPHDPKCGGCGGCGASPGGYMFYRSSNLCGTLLAHLENPSAQDIASCTGACYPHSSYGMNYCLDVRP